MRAIDFIGLLASALVLLTFTMKAMVPLRIVALCSNCAFLIYAIELELVPVLVLHMSLVPINAWRLWQALKSAEKPRRSDGDVCAVSSPRTEVGGGRELIGHTLSSANC
jgi:CRP/FNR family cyclic AMP-dependent transcriptional regulator